MGWGRWHRFVLAVVVVGAQLAPAAPARGVTPELLPDLGMLPPADFSIQSRPRGERWLRFSAVVANIGPGVFDVYGFGTGAERSVVQRIQHEGGGWTYLPSTATMFYAGDGHNHWHVRDLQEWTLTAEQPNATVLRSGAKRGFCFWDNYAYPGTGPKLYSGSTSCHVAGDGSIPMGLSVGWGDKYPATISGQYIDISGLPNGRYRVTLVADQDEEFVEADESNNTSWALIEITRKSVRVVSSGTALPGP